MLPLYPLLEGVSAVLFGSVENSTLDELPMQLVGTLYVLLFVAALSRMAYARLFESDAPAAEGGAEEASAIPVTDFGARRANTAEVSARRVTRRTKGRRSLGRAGAAVAAARLFRGRSFILSPPVLFA